MDVVIAPIQPVHIILSIPLFILGGYVIWHNKKYGHMLQDYDAKRFKTFMDGAFMDSQKTLSKFGYHRFVVAFLGFMIIIFAWVLAVGTICSGDAAQEYRYEHPTSTQPFPL